MIFYPNKNYDENQEDSGVVLGFLRIVNILN